MNRATFIISLNYEQILKLRSCQQMRNQTQQKQIETSSIENNRQLLIPPPPPAMIIPVPPPLSNYQYVNKLKMKHSRIINGQLEEFTNIESQMSNKLNHLVKKSEQNSIYAESTGEGIKIDESAFVLCERCDKKILKSQLSTHMSCHAAIILENLLLGDKLCACNRKQLIQRNKVTHVVNAAYELPNYLQKDGLKYIKLELLDQIDELDFLSEIEKGYQFIKQAHLNAGIVFVHCAVGKSRSVSVILLYLFHEKKLSLEQGLKLIKEKRPIAQPNMDYMRQLKQHFKKIEQQKNKNENIQKENEKESN